MVCKQRIFCKWKEKKLGRVEGSRKFCFFFNVDWNTSDTLEYNYYKTKHWNFLRIQSKLNEVFLYFHNETSEFLTNRSFAQETFAGKYLVFCVIDKVGLIY